jgi:hypothetical protein
VSSIYNPKTNKHDIIKDFCVLIQCIKQKCASSDVKILCFPEVAQWASGGNIWYLHYYLENVGSQVAISMKDRDGGDFKPMTDL